MGNIKDYNELTHDGHLMTYQVSNGFQSVRHDVLKTSGLCVCLFVC